MARRAAGELVAVLARPRLCGSPGARAVETELRRRFEALGYEVRELPFTFSALPGRFGVPVVGAVVAAGAAFAGAALLAGRPGAALLALGLAAGATAALALLARAAVLRLPWLRIATANWLVARPGAVPRFVVVAHRDSKSQRSSLLLRAAAAVGAPGSVLALAALAALALADPARAPAAAVVVASLAGVASGLVLVGCYAGDASPGALDNASGLAALLLLAGRERALDVAFLVTDAEELGLAGALAARGALPPHAMVINLDGLDDAGDFHVMDRRAGRAPPAAGELAEALLAAARDLGFPARRRALPPGVLVDHLPFAAAGHAAVTVMRGGAASLARVHRPADDASRIRGDGVADAVALVAAALARLREGAARTR